MSDDARFDPRFDPAFQPGYVGPIGSAAAPPSAQVVASVPPAVLPPVPLRDDDEAGQPQARLNPFIIALAAISVVLVGGGVYLTSRMRDLYLSTQQGSAFDFTTMQVLIYLAALMIALGIATAIGVLFLLAARWRTSASRG